ncbi:response regulator transcription factor [Verticiella sediminum]|uniref:response regulator transcription factor n=1 Tax=Verticiella sediminum TaxID=1247510 RepID=UPI001FE5FC32|nr:LuxR C-terminal-related transcriptional regulator [Verticiella sediminum]
MAKVVLIETHPLMRLGLTQLIGGMSGSWDVVPLDARAIEEFAYLACDVDLIVLGMPLDLGAGWKLLADVDRLLRPRRMLLLSEPSVTWEPPAGGLPDCVYGCISSTAGIEVVEAAIRLSVSNLPNASMSTAARSTLLAAPGAAAANAGATVAAATVAVNSPAEGAAQRAPLPSAVRAVTTTPSPAPAGVPAQASTLDAAAGAQLLNVTPRQYEVLTLLARGYPIKTVSRILNISTATAKAHASTLYQRLRVSSKGEAVYAARQRGILFD